MLTWLAGQVNSRMSDTARSTSLQLTFALHFAMLVLNQWIHLQQPGLIGERHDATLRRHYS